MPAVLGAYFRTKIPETPRFTAHVMGDVQQAKADMAKVLETSESPDLELQYSEEMYLLHAILPPLFFSTLVVVVVRRRKPTQ